MSCNECNEKTIISTVLGPAGANGMFGGYSSIHTYAGISATAATLTPRELYFDASPASATKIFVSVVDNNNNNVSALLAEFDNSGNYGLVRVVDEEDSSTFWAGEITSVTAAGVGDNAYYELGVNSIMASKGFTLSNASVLTFAPKGNTGTTGPAGADGDNVWNGVTVTCLDTYIPGFSALADADKQQAFITWICTLASDVATNTSDITTNAGNIAANAADIATNTGNIATNAGDIATNTADIATNTGDIAIHAGYFATAPIVFDDEIDCPCEGETTINLVRNFSGIFPAADFSTEDTNPASNGNITDIGAPNGSIRFQPTSCGTSDNFSFRGQDSQGTWTADGTITVNIAEAAAVPGNEVMFARFILNSTSNDSIDDWDLDIRYGDPNGVSVSVDNAAGDLFSCRSSFTSTSVGTAVDVDTPIPAFTADSFTFTGYVAATDEIFIDFMVNTFGSTVSPVGVYIGSSPTIDPTDIGATVFDVELTQAS